MAGEPKELSDDEKLELLALQGYCELASETLGEMSANLKKVGKMFENLRPQG